MYLVKANADLREHAGFQHLVVVALYGGFEAAQAFLHGTGNFLEFVEVSWSQTINPDLLGYSQGLKVQRSLNLVVSDHQVQTAFCDM